MAAIEDISLQDVTKTIQHLDALYAQSPQSYEDILRGISEEFRLAREWMMTMSRMAEQGSQEDQLRMADMGVKQLLALWVLYKDINLPQVHLPEETPSDSEQS
ncbi:hypothetical protein [Desulfohalobium retbaense]|jgi:hypothetical protein|uniref:Uncharacterized protein n=1 Tax=Desulfohalobium retbaense (strain ATCC 49708 / DSM 5692 / JCM 16813 / HR100) TaxID=485915 RepID=C8X0N8_DESRD|nr:hypothetical protein [Desulfohalobium retbaense]ACV67985.1 hypothetical protein Dret_0693 [Desulfohalobium retbaense DSM 5692]